MEINMTNKNLDDEFKLNKSWFEFNGISSTWTITKVPILNKQECNMVEKWSEILDAILTEEWTAVGKERKTILGLCITSLQDINIVII